MGSPPRNMSSTTGYSATPTADFSVIEISECKRPTRLTTGKSPLLSWESWPSHSCSSPLQDIRPRPSSAKCEGAGKLPGGGPLCYQVKVGMFGVTEAIDMRIAGSTESAGSAEETGKMDLTGSGISSFKCSGVDITKNGQTCNPDADQLKHCLPRGITLESADYCSNTDQVQIKIKDSNIPSPAITATASRVKCDSSSDGNAEATDLMWGFPGSSTPKSPEMCGKAINVDVTAGDDPETWVTGKFIEMSPITIGGYYNTIGGSPDRDAYVQKYWPNRKKYFPDAHIHTWEQDSWDCKGNMQGGCNGDRDQWLTLGCEYCVAEEAKAAAGKWAIWHTVNNSNIGCGKGMDNNTACDQDTLPRHGLVKLIATYDDRHFWSPKIWTDYNHPSITVKGTPICCHPVCATDPGCGKETGGLFTCGLVLGGCCELTGFLQCGYAGPHLDCDN